GGDDAPVAGEAAGGAGGDRPVALDVGGADPGLQGLQGGGHDEAVAGPAGVAVTVFGMGHGLAGDVEEGFGAAFGDRVLEHRQVRIPFAGGRGDRGGDL